MQPTVNVDSEKNPKKYKEVCEEFRTSRMIEELCTDKEKRNFIFLNCYNAFNSLPNFSKLMTSCSSEDLDFKKHFEVSELRYIRNPLDRKKVKFELRHQKITEGIKKIIRILTEKDAILKKFDIDDFIINGDKVWLCRFHNIEVFPQAQIKECKELLSISTYLDTDVSLDTRTAVKIMRCNNCHKRMELDLTSIIENPLTKDYTHYICPHCGEKKSLIELIRIYKENKRNSYYWFYKSPWGEKYIAQSF